MGRPRKIRSAKKLEELWEEYKEWCDNQDVLTHEFSAKNSEFVSVNLKRKVTYTIEGFCVYAKIARSAFYQDYMNDDRYSDITARMRDECEVDARMKFELGEIPDRLAPLWMGKYGYSSNKKEEISAQQGIVNDILEAVRDVK